MIETRRPYDEISVCEGLTSRVGPCSSSGMTQRSINRPHNATANIAARTLALRTRALPDVVWIRTALAALVLVVVVLITTPTGAG